MNKKIVLTLILIVAVSSPSLISVRAALAQTPTPSGLPTPSVPTFTLQLVGPPTLVNTTYSLDQNTGQIVPKIGYTNEYSAVNITIKNQVFSNLDGNTVYYNVRIKLDNSTDWSDLFNANDPVFPQQSDSEYTVIPLGMNSPVYTEYYVYPEILVGAKIDIQVQAMIGVLGPSNGVVRSWYSQFDGNTGPWSNTQTVNVPANVPLSPTPPPSSSTSTLTPTQTPTSTSVSPSYASLLLITTVAIVVIAFLLAIIIVLLLFRRPPKKRLTTLNQP